MSAVFEQVAGFGVVPVIAIEQPAHAVPLADALLEGGLGVAEITFRTEAAAEVIAILSDKRPELLTGAGTILSRDQALAAHKAGATFGLAPGFDPGIIGTAAEIGLPFAPGIMTPSDISLAAARGCRLMKFFPAVAAGGVSMLQNISAPFAHLGLKFIPTGGVSEATIADWLALPQIAAVGGTWIARPADMEAGDWKGITARARAARARVQEIRA
ncbi:bifunctional 4-hydroxy-2-oxoglutarate aldolase/2-dehydro-3-deoxy-phosphogluconate aldolase [Pseudogemmobacter bohemicus]|uniref:bifunctional 4-hydroxy-2-oxoglutarate aldolase/2-dehydro-3-deoxy-phosphogluconate aldolase n=1 Tax=Pseudogemmobacter bohemicus TaxID=2250708 RepID=UPI000DD3C3CF|nr:bifunctional 4-hydroxy-2-oxoglutarate aldolase/2-dehydro-3-deoxy-phosphogluconate aldolase [Pseudogemmobacter bohemicus]